MKYKFHEVYSTMDNHTEQVDQPTRLEEKNEQVDQTTRLQEKNEQITHLETKIKKLKFRRSKLKTRFYNPRQSELLAQTRNKISSDILKYQDRLDLLQVVNVPDVKTFDENENDVQTSDENENDMSLEKENDMSLEN